jgi:outer membrane protein, adhesin transport system
VKRGGLRKLALGASCAVLLAVTAQGAAAREMKAGPQTRDPAPVEAADSVTPPHVPGHHRRNTVSEAAGHQVKWSTMTLQQAVGVSVLTNPEHGVVANNRRATDEELRAAKSLYLPSIDTRLDGGYEFTRNPITGASSSSGAEDLWRYNAGVTLTQMLFDGFAARYENLRQQARVLSASHRVQEAAELDGLAAVEDYLEVMRQRELLTIARDNAAAHTKILDQINDSTKAGKTTQADLQQARARLAAARAEEENVRDALRTGEADFIRDIGQQPEDLIMPATPNAALEQNVEEEVKVSLSQSPTIHIYDADLVVAHQEYEATQSSFYPKFDLQLQGQDGENVSALEGQSKNASALVIMNWNLYRGGADIAKRREFINREAQAKEQRAKVARGIEEDVRKTWAGMISSGERTQEFTSQAAANVEVVKAYKDQFDLNRRTLLDVLDSQNELFVARANAINAQYLEMFAVYRMLALKGDLLKTLDVPVPRESDPAKM